eukprot:11580202-Karenia_brevis.AAC.1
MQNHVDAHLSGALSGHIPSEWLQSNGKTRCRVCGLCVAASRGVHPSCHATERRASASQPQQHTTPQPTQSDRLPSLQDVLTTQIPTL